MRRARIEIDGRPLWGVPEGDAIELEDGRTVPEAEARYLPPVEPPKIFATHLTYRSRAEE
jgi:hypothetical protein